MRTRHKLLGLAGFVIGMCVLGGAVTVRAAQMDGGSNHVTTGHITRIVVIGDSTVCNWPVTRTTKRGWGEVLPEFFNSQRVKVINRALSGRSSKSFIDEGHWKAIRQMKPAPDYVLIQFGHNDNPGKGPKRETKPGPMPAQLPGSGIGSKPKDWFRHNIETYIKQSRAMGAVPIVVTPMSRCHFDSHGKVKDWNKPYAQGACAAATALGAPCIDLNTYSANMYEKLGPKESLALQYHAPDGKVDRTHYNAMGASIWAKWITQQLEAKQPELKQVVDMHKLDH